MKIIKEEYSKGTQSANYSKIIESDEGSKIKIDIKSDSYDFQSHARVYAFSRFKKSVQIYSNQIIGRNNRLGFRTTVSP